MTEPDIIFFFVFLSSVLAAYYAWLAVGAGGQ